MNLPNMGYLLKGVVGFPGYTLAASIAMSVTPRINIPIVEEYPWIRACALDGEIPNLLARSLSSKALNVLEVSGPFLCDGNNRCCPRPSMGRPVKNDLFAHCSIPGLIAWGKGFSARVSVNELARVLNTCTGSSVPFIESSADSIRVGRIPSSNVLGILN